MSDNPSIQDFLEVQAHFGLPAVALVEKDWHVLRALSTIAAVDAGPFRLIFAGGTCVARAHRLVSRMSEDVDFKVVSIDSEPVSRNKRRNQLGDLRKRIVAALQEAGFGVGPDDIRSRDDNNYNLLNLHYTDSGGAGEPLRPTIQVELTFATLRHEAATLPVSSFVAEAFDRPPELAAMSCVSITETAAEKLVSLTRRTAMELQGLSRAPDPNLVRHIYDLYAMHTHIDRATTIELARVIALADAHEFQNQYPAYLADIKGETHKALVALQSDMVFRERYDVFVAAMVYGKPVAFDTAIEVVTTMVIEAWP
ncbi:nucleotidyl transferase AbiEii/AbiGii toxin family protein [Undibacterium sp. Di26W]|uniref:nucleotidyl transferase AbiEii/AbiGii toxin family protein n=1 Tax=Undibacterium sp. Di26W TaxID=3413035 RepID=UPI003BEF9E3A